MTISPAYGRDYKSKAAILADLNAGKDFIVRGYDGDGYIALGELPVGRITVRYAQDRKVVMVTIRQAGAVRQAVA